ncbi:MAG: hypothetical protein JWO33_1185 [Caulobacteraceae bacterium]|nr:hypothetical protein [Caulobacteraceae bacterium]
MLNKFFDWLQYGWGAAQYNDGTSYSKLLEGSLNFWGLLEGTHLLTLMLFFGSIMLVDLRLMGVAFREYPVSTIERRLLPLTITAMILLVITGAILFFAKPEIYWHNLMFRTKMVLLVVAMLNIAVFHKLIEKNKDEWDAAPSTPNKAKISAVISLASWILVIASGRFIAYNWFECGKAQPDWVNVTQDCKNSSLGALSQNGKQEGGHKQ